MAYVINLILTLYPILTLLDIPIGRWIYKPKTESVLLDT